MADYSIWQFDRMNIKKNTHTYRRQKKHVRNIYTRFMRIFTRISFFYWDKTHKRNGSNIIWKKIIIIAILMASDSDQTKIWGKHIKALNQNTKKKQSIN